MNEKLVVAEIVLKPLLVISNSQNETKAPQVLEMSEKAWAVRNSITTEIFLESNIESKEKELHKD